MAILNYLKYRVAGGCLICFLLITAGSKSVNALQKEVVPFGIFYLDAEAIQMQSDGFYAGNTAKISGSQYIADRHSLDRKKVTGNYSYSTTEYKLTGGTGIYKTLSVEIGITWASVNQTSTLSYISDNTTDKISDISALYKSGSNSGWKNTEVSFYWEPVYTRTFSLLFGYGYIYSAPANKFNRPDSPPVSTGIHRIKANLQIILYSRAIPYRFIIRLDQSVPQNSVSIKDWNNQDNVYSESPRSQANFENQFRYGDWLFEGGLAYNYQSNSRLRDYSFNNTYTEVAAGISAYYGNFNEFIAENSNVNEYRIGFSYQKTIYAYNHPNASRFGILLHYLF